MADKLLLDGLHVNLEHIIGYESTTQVAALELNILHIAVGDDAITYVCPGRVMSVEKSEHLPASAHNKVSKQGPLVLPVSIALSSLTALNIGMVFFPYFYIYPTFAVMYSKSGKSYALIISLLGAVNNQIAGPPDTRNAVSSSSGSTTFVA